MRKTLILCAALAIAITPPVAAQTRPVETVDDLQWLAIENIVAPVLNPDSEREDEAIAMVEDARALLLKGQLGNARRLYARARTLFYGGTWSGGSEFVASLALRPDRVAVDPQSRVMLAIGQHFPTPDFPRHDYRDMSFRVSARPWSGRGGNAAESGTLALGQWPMVAPDLVEQPQYAPLDLSSLHDGSWTLVAEVMRGEAVLGKSMTRIFISRGLDAKRQRLVGALESLDLRDGLAASIAYPVDLAEGLDRRTRKVMNVDLTAEFDRALTLLDAARTGDDPLWQARGNQTRHYRSAVSDRIEPYRLYIPEDWDGTTPLPLVVMLHGSMGDERSVFAGGELEEEARRRGIAVLSPMGDDPNSVWGNRLPAVLGDGSIPPPRPVISGGRVQPFERLAVEPAEADVAATLKRVREEIPIDPSRIYLGGNSMGGEGTLHLAGKWPEIWAAIAPGAGPIDPDLLDYDRLATLPVLVVHGTRDSIMSLEASRTIVERLRRAGGTARLLSPDAGHDAYHHSQAEVLDFFLSHTKATESMGND